MVIVMPRQHRLLSELESIEQQLSQMVRGPHAYSVEKSNSTWSPAVDIYETPESFILTAEVPGIETDQIDIKVVNGNLILRGERRWEAEAHGDHFHRLESAYGKFERTFTLSEQIDAESITAELDRGVLKVSLPKKQRSGSKQIEINDESD